MVVGVGGTTVGAETLVDAAAGGARNGAGGSLTGAVDVYCLY